MTIEASDYVFYVVALILLISAYLIITSYQLRKHFKINKGSEKKDYFTLVYAITFLFMGIGRLVLAIFDVVTEFNSINYNDSNFWIWKIGSSIQLFGVGLWVLLMEKRVLKGKDKYILTILYSAFIIIGMLMIDILLATTLVILGMLFAVYIPAAYIYIAIKSDGVVRQKAILMFCGFLLIILGSLLPSEQIIAPLAEMTGLLRIQVHDIAFFVIICGIVLLFLGSK